MFLFIHFIAVAMLVKSVLLAVNKPTGSLTLTTASSSRMSLPLPLSLVKPHSDGGTTEWPELGLVLLRGRKDAGLGRGTQGLQGLHQLPDA